jgi:atlastin
LEFLVRDWPNFDPEWEIKRCEKQMRDHLEQHFDHARDSETPDAIKSMFEEISCWMLPHPGLKINKVGWDGRLSDLDKDFVKFLDAYVRKTFGPTLRARKILGNSLSAATFVGVVESFVEAFVDLVPKGASLATAIAKSANLISKEHALSEYRSNLEKTIGGEGSKGVDPDEFVRGEKRARAQALDHFMKGTAFGPEEERDIVKRALVQELDGFRVLYESENRRKMESALTVFAGIALLIGLLYSVDKISDFTCDWYSDTCVRLSNALFLIYITLIVAILTNAYFLYQSRGQAVALVALIEMGKAAVTMIADYSRSVRKIISDWQASRSEDVFSDLRVLGQRIGRDVQSGLIAIGSSFAGAFSRQDPKE